MNAKRYRKNKIICGAGRNQSGAATTNRAADADSYRAAVTELVGKIEDEKWLRQVYVLCYQHWIRMEQSKGHCDK